MVKKRLAILGLVFALTGTTVFGHCYNPSVVYAEEVTEEEITVESITKLKDHWSFEGEGEEALKSDVVIEGTSKSGTLVNGATIADSGSPVFGNALWLSTANGDQGTNGNHMLLSDYINTGTRGEEVSGTSFSMWYRLGENANLNGGSMVLLQPENYDTTSNYPGRTILSLERDANYKTNLDNTGITTPTSVDTSKWQHITVVFDNNTVQDKVYFYVNGILDKDAELNYGDGGVTNKILNLRLGAHKGGSNSMCGYIDEFYVFEKALTAEEAKAVYNEKISEYKALLNEKITEANNLYAVVENDTDEDVYEIDADHTTAFDAVNTKAVAGLTVYNNENATVGQIEEAIEAIETANTNLRNIYQDGVVFEGCSLILDGTIDLNFSMDLEDAATLIEEGAYMNFTLDGVNYSKVYVSELSPEEGTGYYEFKYGVPVKDMGKDVQAQMIVPAEGDTEERKGLVYTYSVKKYIDYVREYSDVYQNALPLVQAMSDFGEYATAYFDKDYKLGEVYGAEAIANITATDLNNYAPKDLPARGIYVGSSLLLKSDTLFRHYFTEIVDVEGDYECKQKDETNYYYIEHTGIAAHELGTGIPITVTIGGVQHIITYSPLTYAYVALEKNSDTALMNLMRAMYLYYQEACNYMSP